VFLQIDIPLHENQTTTPTEVNPAEYLHRNNFAINLFIGNFLKILRKKLITLTLNCTLVNQNWKRGSA